MTTRTEVVAAARSLVDVPFHHQGYNRAGMDCIGVIGWLGLKFGFDGAQEWASDPRFHSYSPQPDLRLQIEGCKRFLDPIEIGEATIADILWVRWETDPVHFALIDSLDPLRVIHALSGIGKVVRARPPTRAHVMRAYRFRGIS